ERRATSSRKAVTHELLEEWQTRAGSTPRDEATSCGRESGQWRGAASGGGGARSLGRRADSSPGGRGLGGLVAPLLSPRATGGGGTGRGLRADPARPARERRAADRGLG